MKTAGSPSGDSGPQLDSVIQRLICTTFNTFEPVLAADDRP